jgi:hypothetical protein
MCILNKHLRCDISSKIFFNQHISHDISLCCHQGAIFFLGFLNHTLVKKQHGMKHRKIDLETYCAVDTYHLDMYV